MATTAERGFSFKDLPTVIDPAVGEIEVKTVPYRAPDADLTDEDVCFAVYHRLIVPDADLPFVRTIAVANLYGDDPDYDKAEIVFGYTACGVLRAVLRRAPDRLWVVEWIPEEFTGEHAYYASVRFPFPDRESATRVADLASRLQVAIQLNQHYDEMPSDAQELVNLVVGRGMSPRLVEVADPPTRLEF
jgi:hypothetical protein